MKYTFSRKSVYNGWQELMPFLPDIMDEVQGWIPVRI